MTAVCANAEPGSTVPRSPVAGTYWTSLTMNAPGVSRKPDKNVCYHILPPWKMTPDRPLCAHTGKSVASLPLPRNTTNTKSSDTPSLSLFDIWSRVCGRHFQNTPALPFAQTRACKAARQHTMPLRWGRRVRGAETIQSRKPGLSLNARGMLGNGRLA